MELSAKLYEEMAKRAKHFFRISSYDVATGRYDIALFHIEQAVQLALKAYLFRVFGDFPKTHSVKELIDLSESECSKGFQRTNGTSSTFWKMHTLAEDILFADMEKRSTERLKNLLKVYSNAQVYRISEENKKGFRGESG
jgi:hypothetical protein